MLLLSISQHFVTGNAHSSQNKDMPNSYLQASPYKLPEKKPTSARNDLGLYSVDSTILSPDQGANRCRQKIAFLTTQGNWTSKPCIAPSHSPGTNTTEKSIPYMRTDTNYYPQQALPTHEALGPHLQSSSKPAKFILFYSAPFHRLKKKLKNKAQRG